MDDRRRSEGVRGAREAFYAGAPARAVDEFFREHGGLVTYDDRIPSETAQALVRLGHDVQPWGLWNWRACEPTVTYRDPDTGSMIAAGDVRRETSSLGYQRGARRDLPNPDVPKAHRVVMILEEERFPVGVRFVLRQTDVGH